MWASIARRLLYNIPVYLGIIMLVMLALRVNDPIWAFLTGLEFFEISSDRLEDTAVRVYIRVTNELSFASDFANDHEFSDRRVRSPVLRQMETIGERRHDQRADST